MKKRIYGLVAICLILTMIWPWKTTEAASKMKMSKSSKTLYLNEDNKTNTSDTFDFGITNKPAGYKSKYTFTWYTDDSSIIKVAKGGVVTAKKVGQTKVKCDIKKKNNGKLYTTVSATITVKANAESVTIKNAPEDNKMEVGTTFDFNRTMKAANGGKATDETEWISSDKKIMTIDKNGVATAIAAGEVEIICRTYQSKATKELGATAQSEPVKITVPNRIVQAEPIFKDTIRLILDGEEENLTVNDFYVKEGKEKTSVPINNIEIDKTNTSILLHLERNMQNETSYEIGCRELKPAEITMKIGAPASIQLKSVTAKTDTVNSLDVHIYDMKGFDLTDSVLLKQIHIADNSDDAYVVFNQEKSEFQLFATKAETVQLTMTYNEITDKAEVVILELNPSATPTPSVPDNSTPTATPEPTATATPEPTATAAPEPTATAAPEPTATAAPEPTATVTPEPTATATPEPTATATPEPTATATPEPTAMVSAERISPVPTTSAEGYLYTTSGSSITSMKVNINKYGCGTTMYAYKNSNNIELKSGTIYELNTILNECYDIKYSYGDQIIDLENRTDGINRYTVKDISLDDIEIIDPEHSTENSHVMEIKKITLEVVLDSGGEIEMQLELQLYAGSWYQSD